MCKGAGIDDGGRWVARDGLYLLLGLFKSSYIYGSRKCHLGLDKPGGPKRHLTNAVVNFKPIPPI